MSEVVREKTVDGVTLLRLNRPEQLNALSMSLRAELAQHINALIADDATRCIVITGNERAFAAGADIGELAHRTPLDADFERSRVAWQALESCPKPIIAALHGFALGGGFELAMHCDIIVAGNGATIGQPEVRLGIMPGAGGTQRFVRCAGKFAAMRWLLTGDRLTADEALRLGLVSEVVADADVLTRALELAGKIAALAPLAVRAIKESVLLGPDAPLPVALLLERKNFQLLFASEDRTEGMAAFTEKRKPQFKGK
jgi:enoyl-CoA hydratase/carnithine racemase